MKKSISLLLLGCLFSNLSIGQGPAVIASLADSLREAGKIKLAIGEFAKNYQEDPSNRSNTYNYACALALDRQIDSAFHYLNIATATDSTISVLNDPDLYFLIKDKRWQILEEQIIQRVEAKHGKYKKVALSKELWSMAIKDQAFYYHLNIAEKTAGRGSPIRGALWELKKKINAENLKRIEQIISTHGWPKQSAVGGSAANAAFLIIQHSDIEIQKKYLPLMKEAANNGEANWSALALLIDRINLREDKKQIYGSQIYRNDDGSFFVKNLEAPEFVNQRRKKVGLGPIEDYVKNWGIEWTVEQKER